MSYKAKQTPLNFYSYKHYGTISDHDIGLAFQRIPIPDPKHHFYISNNPHGFTWDLSDTIGNRPVWKGYHVGNLNCPKPPTHKDTNDYGCYTPYWCPRCS